MGAWDRSQVKLSLVRCHIYLADKSILGHTASRPTIFEYVARVVYL